MTMVSSRQLPTLEIGSDQQLARSHVRIKSIDVARGFTMLMMIYVDNQGASDPDQIAFTFRETEWNGISPADIVFPTFLFIAGLAIPLASAKHRFKASWPYLRKILFRSAKMIAIGVFLNLWAASFSFAKLIIPGVLQRIGLCYGSLALLFLTTSDRVLIAITVLAATLYCAIMYGLHVPGCGRSHLSPECNAGAYLDRKVFGLKHMPAGGTIPEGLLSTCTAFVTTAIGLRFGLVLQARKTTQHILALQWLLESMLLVGTGLLLSRAVDCNKKLWSPSFTLLAAGSSGLCLVAWLVLADMLPAWLHGVDPTLEQQMLLNSDSPPVIRQSRLARLTEEVLTAILAPLRWLGRNPALVFILMVALEILLMDTLHIKLTDPPGHESAWHYWYRRNFGYDDDQRLSSSLFATYHFVLWALVCGVLDTYHIYITL